MATATKKTYWQVILTENYRFQERQRMKGGKLGKTQESFGVLKFVQTYGICSEERHKQVLELQLHHPLVLSFGIGCNAIERIWWLKVEDIPAFLCEEFAGGSISAEEFAELVVRRNPISERFSCVMKNVNLIPEGEDISTLRRYLQDGLAIWVSNGSGLREEEKEER